MSNPQKISTETSQRLPETFLPLPNHKKSREYGNPRIRSVKTIIKTYLLLNMPKKTGLFPDTISSYPRKHWGSGVGGGKGVKTFGFFWWDSPENYNPLQSNLFHLVNENPNISILIFIVQKTLINQTWYFMGLF